jgi:hypothetical protein
VDDLQFPAAEPKPAVDTFGVPDLAGGPYDLEFFLDPLCPFAWQTSVWVRQIAGLRALKVGWRFISLYVIHEHDEGQDAATVARRRRALQFHRVLAGVRATHGNDEVGRLYQEWGRQLWYDTSGGSTGDVAASIDISALLRRVGLRPDLAEAADDDAHDAVIRAETALAFQRAGDDLGTPIISYDPPYGSSFFGPVISSVPGDEESLALYDALRTLAAYPDFAEVKRTKRPPLDLPIFST